VQGIDLANNMDYKNLNHYSGEMSAVDLCDAIVEAKEINIPEVREATRMLVDDLRDAILSSDVIYYLRSNFTKCPHISERFSVFIFTDKYYAEKFVENNANLNLEVVEVSNEGFEKMFSMFYDCGAEAVDYCNDANSVMFGIEHFFLSSSYNKSLCSARALNRFILISMQEIRNTEKQYERKSEIVTLLKKNIVAESLSTTVLVPVVTNGEFEDVENQLVNVPMQTQMNVATVTTPNGELFFPVYTNVSEFNSNPIDGLKVARFSMLSFIRFVYDTVKNNENVLGIIVNPSTVNFAMTEPILDIILGNAQNK
jgi:hypothetical protein